MERGTMNYTFYEAAILFFTYSFLAWLAETTVATIKEKDFRNRGFASGPFCFLYGFTGVFLTVFLQELKEDTVFLFLGSMAVATAVEWFAGKMLERMKRKKWWDYSGKRWNFDGYICLQYSLLWGLLGVLAVRYGNGFLLELYNFLPDIIGKVAIWGLLAVGFIDFAGSLLSIYHVEEKLPRLLGWNHRLRTFTLRLAVNVSGRIENRIGRSYPAISQEKTEEKSTEKCSFVQLFWLFLIGAFLGDITETIFCRITAGVWMSRSSVVYGPFSIVWGLGCAFLTMFLYKYKDKRDSTIFLAGTVLGGAYEYICSVFTELVFGTVFWDYSKIPFNLGGRINLLFCFFWGIAAVVWLKVLYPFFSKWIEKIPKKVGKPMIWIAVILMTINIGISALALYRYSDRQVNPKAENALEEFLDLHFDDTRMDHIYPNAKIRK